MALKHSLTRGVAKSSNLVKIEKDLREVAGSMAINYKNQKVKPLKTEQPVKMNITFLSSYFADTAELLPMINRIDGLTVDNSAENMIEACKIFELLVIATLGISGIHQ
ncbi:MAG: M55 family metallopeptidase [Candidatus Hodarchaeota archaeon]